LVFFPGRRPSAALKYVLKLRSADVDQRVGPLPPEPSPYIRSQRQAPTVEEPVVGAAERDHAVRMRAAPKPLRH
jgi:hypothetical protein